MREIITLELLLLLMPLILVLTFFLMLNDSEETRRRCLERDETMKTITQNIQTIMKTTMKTYLAKGERCYKEGKGFVFEEHEISKKKKEGLEKRMRR